MQHHQQQNQQQDPYMQRRDSIQHTDENQRPTSSNIRRNSKVLSPQDKPSGIGIGQTLNDRLDKKLLIFLKLIKHLWFEFIFVNILQIGSL